MRFEEADILLSVSGVLEGGRVGGPQRKEKNWSVFPSLWRGYHAEGQSLSLCPRGVDTRE